MKNHWSVKLISLILAALCGAAVVVSSYGILMSEQTGFVERAYRSYSHQELNRLSWGVAADLVGDYVEQETGIPRDLLDQWILPGHSLSHSVGQPEQYDYELFRGDLLEGTIQRNKTYEFTYYNEFSIPQVQMVLLTDPDFQPTLEDYRALRSQTEWPEALADFPRPMQDTEYFRYEMVGNQAVRLDVGPWESYQVTLAMTGGQVDQWVSQYGQVPRELPQMMRSIWGADGYLILLGSAVVLWLGLGWLLCSSAGKKPGTAEFRAAGLNRLPLDLYTVAAVGGFSCLLLVTTNFPLYYLEFTGFQLWLWLGLLAVEGMGLALIPLLLAMAFLAQKREGIWGRNTLCARILHWCLHTGRRMARWLWQYIKKGGRIFWEPLHRLPLCWQWMVGFGAVWLLGLLGMLLEGSGAGVLLMVLCAALGAVLIFYLAGAYARLHEAASQMAKGDLAHKIPQDDPWFRGSFGTFAADLNTLSDTCMESAREQMKSQRMKTELITNVSHDIKTPLTSIINYVDLLQQTQDEAQRQVYLEVLERQSQKLKKLIEDLMEMSKASSGSLSAERTPTDLGEAVSQALGEFSDRMEERGLQTLWERPRQPVTVLADGRLLWRVLSNVLGNVVKYAMEGTRVYVDAAVEAGKARLSVKNISAQMLNVPAAELMERFVRGDRSRNTEGNGLGLNIAASLMEVQGGQLELVVDGDLFKVVLTLPLAEDTIAN